MENKKKVVVVGGGFAGLNITKKLDPKLFDVLLIDKVNHHQFQPLFYQVATSQLEPSTISFPLRHIFHHKKNVQILMSKVLSIDLQNKTLKTTIGEISYDYLILAMGCKTNFFGNENIGKYAYTLKTTYDAIAIRNHILETFEKMISANEQEKKILQNIVIVGAGPTGVELAGAFAEIKKNILPRDFHNADFSNLKILLIEGTKFTLNNMSDNSKKNSRKYLEKFGVEIVTEVFVKNYDGENLILSNGETIKTKTVIWAAGVTPNTIAGIPQTCIGGGNRIKVDRFNKIVDLENVFALGDIALMATPKYPKGHPQLANVAINQAKNLAENMKRMQNNKPLKEYEYKDLGSMATIGRNKAVVDLTFAKFKGLFAWFVWMFLHLMLILSVKNKLIIFINWAYEYFSKDTSLRLILKDSKETEH